MPAAVDERRPEQCLIPILMRLTHTPPVPRWGGVIVKHRKALTRQSQA